MNLTNGSGLKLIPIKANMTELVLNEWRILFSYSTPVAAQDRSTKTIYTTQKHWSNTTSRHVNKWVAEKSYKINQTPSIISQPQEFFDNLVKGA